MKTYKTKTDTFENILKKVLSGKNDIKQVFRFLNSVMKYNVLKF